MKVKSMAFINALGLVIALVVNAMANALPINGIQTGELSDLYPNLFVPAGLTFSIWGLIYLWLLVLVVYGFITAYSSDPSSSAWIEKMGPWFVINMLCNAGWIFAWHYKMVGLSLLLMLALLVTLVLIYQKLGIRNLAAAAKERWLVHAAIGLYLGWIIIATVANTTALLVDSGFTGGGISEAIWTMLVLGVATGIVIFFQLRKSDMIPSFVALWAFLGIYIKRSNDAAPISELLLVLGILAAVILGFGVWRFLIRKET